MNQLRENLWTDRRMDGRTDGQKDTILSLNVPIPDKKKKLTEIFILTLLCGASEGFMKAFKAFIKSFKAPQRSAKIKI